PRAPRPDAARRSRHPLPQAPARAGRRNAGHHPHRARPGVGPDRGPERGRRRLPREALRPCRTVGADRLRRPPLQRQPEPDYQPRVARHRPRRAQRPPRGQAGAAHGAGMGALRGAAVAARPDSVQGATGGKALCLRRGGGEQHDRGPRQSPAQETRRRGHRDRTRARLPAGRGMRLRPRSLRGRLGLSLGLALTLLWIAAASITAVVVRHELDEVFDATLEETAQRILPLAVVDIVGREDEGVTQRLAAIRSHEEFYTYIVRDAQGRILLQSHAADPAAFPAYDGPGFRDTATHRFYNDDALKGTVRISVAEPLAHRKAVARQIQMALGLPLLVVIPAALLAIVLAVGGSLAAIGRFSDRLTARNARDLAPVPV